MRFIRKIVHFSWLMAFLLILTTSCENQNVIISSVNEREANEIVVFLASKGIDAQKIPAKAAGPGAETTGPMFSIVVNSSQAVDALALLNQFGLPRKQGTNLLELFAKQGLMSSDKEETIRYRAGLAAQIANTIRKIDGVIDADVQLSFPDTENLQPGATSTQKVTASVYIKHQGIIDDPNSHLITKIKRLVAGSVNGLDVNDVTVISDRAYLSDITLNPKGEPLSYQPEEYVSIWNITLSKQSAGAFRLLFFLLTFFIVLLGAGLIWTLWKFYPQLKKLHSWKDFFSPAPFNKENKEETHPEEEK